MGILRTDILHTDIFYRHFFVRTFSLKGATDIVHIFFIFLNRWLPSGSISLPWEYAEQREWFHCHPLFIGSSNTISWSASEMEC